MNIVRFHVIFSSCLTVLLMSIRLYYGFGIPKDEDDLVGRRVIDLLVQIMFYSTVVIYSNFTPISKQLLFLKIVPTLLPFFQFHNFFTFFTEFKKNTNAYLSQNNVYILVSALLIGILFSLSALNYVSFALFPSWYEMPNNWNTYEIGFNFIYYTFSLIITYSGNSITACSVSAKILQMIEVVFAYYIFSDSIIQAIRDKTVKNLNQ